MALSIPPNKNLGAGDKWGRWVESALSNFDRSISQLSRNLDSKVRSLNSAISRVSTNLAERVLTQRLVVQQDTDTGSRTTIGFTLDPDSETVTDYPGIWLYPPGDSMGYQATLQIPSSGSPGLFLKDDSGTTRASITSEGGLYLRYANGVNATATPTTDCIKNARSKPQPARFPKRAREEKLLSTSGFLPPNILYKFW